MMDESTRNDIVSRLGSLRHVLIAESDRSRVDFFDDLTEHHEFGLALHEICEYLLERDASNIAQSDLDQIEVLHHIMEVSDKCADELRRRLARPTAD
jgi:hypothetical protein